MSKRGLGYTYVHSAIDAYSRLAYSEFAGYENAANCTAFLERAVAWFADQGIVTERILTDNGNGYRSRGLGGQDGRARHRATRGPGPTRRERTGRAERFNRTLLDEWAYKRLWRSEAARAKGLDRFLHTYNHHRHT